MSDARERRLRFILSAAADRSLGTVVQPLTDSVARARAKVSSDAKGMADDMSGAAKRGAGELRRLPAELREAFEKAEREAKTASDSIARSATDAGRAAKGAFTGLDVAVGLEFDRADRAARARGQKLVNGFTSTLKSIGAMAARFGGSVLGGLGVNFDVGALIHKGVAVETSAVDITNRGFQAQGRRAGAADVKATEAAIRGAADANKLDHNLVAQGLDKFVEKAPKQFELAKSMLADIGKLAQASGRDVSELGEQAGTLARHLENTPGKAEKVMTVLRTLARQGELGGLGEHVGRLAGRAERLPGDFQRNVTSMIALAQVARQGGADDKTAASSAAMFVGNLMTPGAIKAFGKQRIHLFEDEKGFGRGGTKLRPMQELLTDVFHKTGGNARGLGELFRGTAAQNVVEGLGKLYRGDDGGRGGSKGIRDALGKFTESLSKEDVDSGAKLKMESTAAKVQEFQNRLEQVASEMAHNMLPNLQKLAPAAIQAAEALAKLAEGAVENPGLAIVTAITASIARAGIGTAVSEGLVGLLRGGGALGGLGGLGGLGAGGPGALAGVGMAGPIAATLAIGTAAFVWSAQKDTERMQAQRKADTSDAARVWQAQNAPVAKAMADAGLPVDPYMGMTPEGARRFGSNKAESDKLEAAVRAHRLGGDGTPNPYQVSPEQADRLRELAARWGMPQGNAGGDAKKDPVPTLESLLQAQLKGNAILQNIADKTGGPNPGPMVPDAGRVGVPASH
jgi:hypothetical protein